MKKRYGYSAIARLHPPKKRGPGCETCRHMSVVKSGKKWETTCRLGHELVLCVDFHDVAHEKPYLAGGTSGVVIEPWERSVG